MRSWRRISGSPPGPLDLKARRAGGRHGRAPRPRLPRPCSWAKTSAPRPGRSPRPAAASRARSGQPSPTGAAPGGFRRPGHPGPVPLATLAGLADRPGELAGPRPPSTPGWPATWAAAAAQNRKTTWCVTVDRPGRARHRTRLRPPPNPRTTGNAPDPARRARPGSPSPRAAGTARPAGYGNLAAPHPRNPGRNLIITLDPITTDPCDHRHEAKGHDPRGQAPPTYPRSGTPPAPAPSADGPAAQCDLEHKHSLLRQADAACLCNTPAPKCRHDHPPQAAPPSGTSTSSPTAPSPGTTPAGRTYTTEPTRYPHLTAGFSPGRVPARRRLPCRPAIRGYGPASPGVGLWDRLHSQDG